MKTKMIIKRLTPQCIYDFHDRIKVYRWWKKIKAEAESNVNRIIDAYVNDEKYKDEIDYLRKNGADYFPYVWANKKFIWKIKMGGLYDVKGNERYVIHHGKKLYVGLMPYTQLWMEQHDHSPHRYFSDQFKLEEGDCFVDVGAAEGMISLEVVEKASKVFLIECNEEWIRSLNYTFQNYMDKVHIIRKYASDHDDNESIRLDTLLREIDAPIMIKIDVEGMERDVLKGAERILDRKDTKIAICTYHNPQDEEEFYDFFKWKGYSLEKSDGYMCMLGCPEKPWFRKAVLRAWKE